jgi:hypothetical protein
MTAFHNQIRLGKPRDQVFASALSNFTQPLGSAGFKIQEQDPAHIIWARGWRWGLLWGGFSFRKRVTMSFVETDDGGTVLTIAGDAPRRIARSFQRLTI